MAKRIVPSAGVEEALKDDARLSTSETPYCRIPHWVLELELSPLAFRAYCVLRTYVRPGSEVPFPSAATLAERLTGKRDKPVARRSVFRALEELESAGLCRRYKRSRTDGARSSSLFVMAFDSPLEAEGQCPNRHRGGDETVTGVVTEPSPQEKELLEEKQSERAGGGLFGEKGLGPLDPNPAWAKSDTAHSRAVQVFRAVAKIPKYQAALAGLTEDACLRTWRFIMAEAPSVDDAEFLLREWREFHTDDVAGRYGRRDPLASLRNRLKVFIPKWRQKKRIDGRGKPGPDELVSRREKQEDASTPRTYRVDAQWEEEQKRKELERQKRILGQDSDTPRRR